MIDTFPDLNNLNVDDCAALFSGQIQNVTEKIASDLYEFYTKRNSNKDEHRYVRFLHNLCASSSTHIRIDRDNCEKIISDEDLFIKPNPRDEIIGHFKRKNDLIAKKFRIKELIRKEDEKRLGGWKLETGLKPKLRQLALKERESIQLENQLRNRRLKIIYAMINTRRLELSDALMIMFRDFAKHDCLTEHEITLVNIVCSWRHLPDHYAVEMLNQFHFVYEKPLLKMCTTLLTLDPSEVDDFIRKNFAKPDINKILGLARKDATLKMSISSMLYELYKRSNFNSNLVKICRALA